MSAVAVPVAHAPRAARELAAACARAMVAVEAGCEREGCGPDCRVAMAARRVAVSAADLAEREGVVR